MVTAQPTQPDVAARATFAKPNLLVSWRKHKAYVVAATSVIVFLVAWQIAGSQMNPILISTPTAVAHAFAHMASIGILWPAFLRAMEDLFFGFFLAVIVGVGLGLLMGRYPNVDRVASPYVTFFQATPLIALTPLVVIWFGIGVVAEVAITFLLAVWTIIINTAEGVKATPPILLEMAEIYHASERTISRRISIPNAVPYIFAGFKIAVAKALIGMMIAGMDISLKGLGGIVATYGDEFKTAYLLAAVILSSIVGVILTILIALLRRVIAPWSISEKVTSMKVRW